MSHSLLCLIVCSSASGHVSRGCETFREWEESNERKRVAGVWTYKDTYHMLGYVTLRITAEQVPSLTISTPLPPPPFPPPPSLPSPRPTDTDQTKGFGHARKKLSGWATISLLSPVVVWTTDTAKRQLQRKYKWNSKSWEVTHAMMEGTSM